MPIVWQQTEKSGYKFLDDVVGTGAMPVAGDVVQVHYTVTLISSGTTLGTSRGGQPLTFAIGKHDVPIWDEALPGMRIGGKRRLVVPPTAIPETQADKVPGENRVLRFDFELLGTLDKNQPMAVIANIYPPGNRRASIARSVYGTLLALSFVPYFMPYDMQPSVYHDGLTREQIVAKREAAATNRFLGGDIKSIEGLFP